MSREATRPCRVFRTETRALARAIATPHWQTPAYRFLSKFTCCGHRGTLFRSVKLVTNLIRVACRFCWSSQLFAFHVVAATAMQHIPHCGHACAELKDKTHSQRSARTCLAVARNSLLAPDQTGRRLRLAHQRMARTGVGRAWRINTRNLQESVALGAPTTP